MVGSVVHGRTTVVLVALLLVVTGSARADAPLSQGFEDGAPAWSTTGMWHVQADPETVAVVPAIADNLVTLPDDGHLPAAVEGSHVAWFGESSTGTYCGSDYATIKQTPQDGCTSTHPRAGALTSPVFSLAGRSAAYVSFRAWWEIEAVQADVADLMRVDWSDDDGVSWHGAGALNPLEPAWGGGHQPFSDGGARASGSWQSYIADISGAAGASNVRLRFVFDTVDAKRNGFRGLLVDGVAVVNPLGATITEEAAGPFTDAPPSVSVEGTQLVQTTTGGWTVQFNVVSSHTSSHPVGVDWSVHGHGGTGVGAGHVTIDAGQTVAPVTVPVSGADAPYTVSIANPSGATLDPGGSSSPTPGGALPLVGIDSVGAAPTGNGLASVDAGVGVSTPAATPISVNYVLAGSDGVQLATGTLTIPAGETGATANLVVSAAHSPYTVSLTSAVGALIDPAGAQATTSPLAVAVPTSATTAGAGGTTGGDQLVLGVRQAGSGGPTLNDTFLLSSLSGTILYHTPSGRYVTLHGTVELPLGSVVDATNGHAVVTVDIDGNGNLQQAELWEGKFGVFQVGKPAVAELRLAGGDYSACVGAAKKKKARRSASTSVRHLWASAKGRFRTKGRYASATIRGTKWLTEDLCLATRITVAEGLVGVLDFRRKRVTTVAAGHSLTVGALRSSRYRKRLGIHGPRLSNA